MSAQSTAVEKTATTAVEKKTKADKFIDELTAIASSRGSLRRGITPASLARATALTVMKQPKLMKADGHSLHLAMVEAGQNGLLPDGRRAALVPYNTKIKLADGTETWKTLVQYQPMVWGLVELMNESPEVLAVESAAVFEGEEFRYNRGLHPDLVHVPSVEPDPNKMTYVYAIAWLKNGRALFEVRTKKQIDGIMARSKAAKSGPWVTDYIPMARKTVLKALANYVPLTAAVEAVIRHDDEVEYQEAVVEHEDQPALPKAQRLMGQLGIGDDEEPVEEQESEDEGEAEQAEPEGAGFDLSSEDTDEEVDEAEKTRDMTYRSRVMWLKERVEAVGGGVIDPDEFIAIAERMGSINESFFQGMKSDAKLKRAINQAVDLKAKEAE